MKKPLNQRTWLNPSNSDYNSYVAIHADRSEARIEFHDCTHTVDFHIYGVDGKVKTTFIKKLMKIRMHIDVLISYLEED